jgi:hypothetical protein
MTQFLTKSLAAVVAMGVLVTLWGQTLSHVVA